MQDSAARADRNDTLKIVAAFAAIYIIWGTTYLAIRIAVETIPPFLMAGTRFLIAGTASFAFLRARGVPLPSRPQLRSAAIVGAFLLVGGNGLVTWSEQQVPSGIAALVVATVPLWMTLFEWLIYKGAKPTRQIVAGLALGLTGIILLIGPGQLRGTAGFDLISLLILLMAPILWSLGSLYSRQANLPENVFMSTSVEMLAGGVLLFLAGILTGEPSQLDIGAISGRSLASMFYLSLFGSIVALTAYVWLLKTVEPARVATYTYVNPVIAVFLGWLVLGEPVSSLTIVAVALIVLAVALITAHKQKQTAPEPKVVITPATVAPCEPGTAGD